VRGGEGLPVTSDEIREHLSAVRLRDPHARFSNFARRYLADPVRPEDGKGDFRLSRLILWLGAIGLCAGVTFVYFTFVQP
jgi:hypothetical protein